jgi:hypothetical protein
MSALVQELQSKGDAAVKVALGRFSNRLTEASKQSFDKTIQELADAIPSLDAELLLHTDSNDARYFPMRPVLHAGDDLTFICHGRLGVSVAVRQLLNFEAAAAELMSEWSGLFRAPLTACAGVLIMPQKFPFSRAYRLCSQLCDSAKAARANRPDPNQSYLDFHLLTEGAGGDLSSIREDSCRASDGGNLLYRPYSLRLGRTFADFESLQKQLRAESARSSNKDLADALVSGKQATEVFLSHMHSRGKQLPDPGDAGIQSSGWTEDSPTEQSTPYYDPLEMLDFHVPIVWGPEQQAVPEVKA